jgi:hypothetical protein
MTPITRTEVEIAAHNAAIIANCSCPARYRSTEWEQVWRNTRAETLKQILGK